MALYKHGHHLTQSHHEAFDTPLTPGTIAAYPGVYRCIVCGDEIGIAKGHALPRRTTISMRSRKDPSGGS